MSHEFTFDGEISASKSLFNRALVVQSFAPSLTVLGASTADDVVAMRAALATLTAGRAEPIDCGEAGTVLRFMALRASRIPGVHTLTGSERLFARPHNELIPILSQLSVDAEFK